MARRWVEGEHTSQRLVLRWSIWKVVTGHLTFGHRRGRDRACRVVRGGPLSERAPAVGRQSGQCFFLIFQ